MNLLGIIVDTAVIIVVFLLINALLHAFSGGTMGTLEWWGIKRKKAEPEENEK